MKNCEYYDQLLSLKSVANDLTNIFIGKFNCVIVLKCIIGAQNSAQWGIENVILFESQTEFHFEN